jgi:hypothetical protein
MMTISNKQTNKSLFTAFIKYHASNDFFINLIRVSLYPSNFGVLTNNQQDFISYVQEFLKDLANVCRKYKLENEKNIVNYCNLANTILNIRQSKALINYSNVNVYVASNTLSVASKDLLNLACTQPIQNVTEFKEVVNEIASLIQAYYEICSIKTGLIFNDELCESISDGKLALFEAMKVYKENIINQFNDLSKLQSLNKKENVSNWFTISDKHSCRSLAKTISSYLKDDYSFFKTGFEIFDTGIRGFESSSIHMITAPSNNGKSTLLLNLCHTIIRDNIDTFDKDDAILYLTVEDDIYKLVRKFISVFGDYTYNLCRELFNRTREFQQAKNNDAYSAATVENLFDRLLQTSVAKVTNGKVNLILRHENENTFSPGDIGHWIDLLKTNGLKVKAIFIDYVDPLVPTLSKYTNFDDYNSQGVIIQELRNLARNFKIPVITASQNAKTSENIGISLDNSQIGDSYKKIRYCDFVYMCRMRNDLTFLSDQVRRNVLDHNDYDEVNGLSAELLKIKDDIINRKVLIPFELKITKSKETGKDTQKFLLFCTDNCKIYNNIREYLADAPTILKKSALLEQELDALTAMSFSDVTDVFAGDDMSFDV